MSRSAEPCEIVASIAVNQSVQQCWNVYINNALVPSWAPAVSNIEVDTPLLEQGITRKLYINQNNKQGHTVERCTSIDPLKFVAFGVIEETFGFSHMLNDYGFEATFDVEGAGTLMVLRTRYTAKKIFASFMGSDSTHQLLQQLMLESLNGFRQYLERPSFSSKSV